MSKESVALLKSKICTQEQLESKLFQDWAERFGEARGHIHRKIWEWCFITQALHERNLLRPGISGLGFAVGTEPLASLFCSFGASICATDIFTDIAKEQGWIDTNQHASGIQSLNSRKLCSDELFKQNCTFRHVDMNDIPSDMKDFDFIWSSCALEHLGSLKHGEKFIQNAMNCLKPGGIAVHTTEYNFSSDSSTISSGDTVLYRRQDIEKIAQNIREQGHYIDIDFTAGYLPSDIFIDLPPYKHNPHLKLQLGEYVVTSIGLIIQKSTSSATAEKKNSTIPNVELDKPEVSNTITLDTLNTIEQRPKREDVINIYNIMLGRSPESEAVIVGHLNSSQTIRELIKTFANSPEFIHIICKSITDHR